MSERRSEPRRTSDKLAFYPWYPRDFNSDGPVSVMTLEEECCYRRLLDYQWLNGSVPSDVPTLARICKNISTRRMQKIWAVLAPMFPDGKNRRLEREREAALARSLQAQGAAELRWERERQRQRQMAASGSADAYPSAHADAHATASPEQMRPQCYAQAQAQAQAEQPPHTRALLARFTRKPERRAVTEFLDAQAGPAREQWVRTLEGCFQGLGMRGGQPATAPAIAATCQDFLGKPPADQKNFNFFRICVARAMDEIARARSPSRAAKQPYTGYLEPEPQ